MPYYKGAGMQWWAEAISTDVYLINRYSNSANHDVSPFELAFKMKPRIYHLRVFGSQELLISMTPRGRIWSLIVFGVCFSGTQRT